MLQLVTQLMSPNGLLEEYQEHWTYLRDDARHPQLNKKLFSLHMNQVQHSKWLQQSQDWKQEQ